MVALVNWGSRNLLGTFKFAGCSGLGGMIGPPLNAKSEIAANYF